MSTNERTLAELRAGVLSAAQLTPATWEALWAVVSGTTNDTVPGSGGSLLSFAIGGFEAAELVEAGYVMMTPDRMGGMTGVVATSAGRRVMRRVESQLLKLSVPALPE